MRPALRFALVVTLVLAGSYLVFCSIAMADPSEVLAAATGPSWEAVATGATGLVMTFVSGWVASLNRKLTNIDKQQSLNMVAIQKLDKDIRDNYHNRRDLKEFITDPLREHLVRLQATVDALHTRNDMEGKPSAAALRG